MDDGRNEGLARTLLLSFIVLVSLMWMGDQDAKSNSVRVRVPRNNGMIVPLNSTAFEKNRDFVHFNAYMPAPYLATTSPWHIEGNRSSEVPPLRLSVLLHAIWCKSPSSENSADCKNRSELSALPIYGLVSEEEYTMEFLKATDCDCKDKSDRCVNIKTSTDTGPICVPDPQSDVLALLDDTLYYVSIATREHFQWAVDTHNGCRRPRKLFLDDEFMNLPSTLTMSSINFPICHTLVDLKNGNNITGCKVINATRDIYNSLIVIPTKLSGLLVEIGFDSLGALVIRGTKKESFMNPDTFRDSKPTNCFISNYSAEYVAVFPAMKMGWMWVPSGDDTLVIASDGGQWNHTRITIDLKSGKYATTPVQSLTNNVNSNN